MQLLRSNPFSSPTLQQHQYSSCLPSNTDTADVLVTILFIVVSISTSMFCSFLATNTASCAVSKNVLVFVSSPAHVAPLRLDNTGIQMWSLFGKYWKQTNYCSIVFRLHGTGLMLMFFFFFFLIFGAAFRWMMPFLTWVSQVVSWYSIKHPRVWCPFSAFHPMNLFGDSWDTPMTGMTLVTHEIRWFATCCGACGVLTLLPMREMIPHHFEDWMNDMHICCCWINFSFSNDIESQEVISSMFHVRSPHFADFIFWTLDKQQQIGFLRFENWFLGIGHFPFSRSFPLPQQNEILVSPSTILPWNLKKHHLQLFPRLFRPAPQCFRRRRPPRCFFMFHPRWKPARGAECLRLALRGVIF